MSPELSNMPLTWIIHAPSLLQMQGAEHAAVVTTASVSQRSRCGKIGAPLVKKTAILSRPAVKMRVKKSFRL